MPKVAHIALLVFTYAAPHVAAYYDARETRELLTMPAHFPQEHIAAPREGNALSGCRSGATACYLGTQWDVTLGEALYLAGRHRQGRLGAVLKYGGLAATGASTFWHVQGGVENQTRYDSDRRYYSCIAGPQPVCTMSALRHFLK